MLSLRSENVYCLVGVLLGLMKLVSFDEGMSSSNESVREERVLGQSQSVELSSSQIVFIDKRLISLTVQTGGGVCSFFASHCCFSVLL